MSPAFQDLIPDNNCWGCGPHNEQGLRIKSHWARPGEDAVCIWTPQPFHCAGPPDVLNGGVIAALLDCHGVGTAMADAYRLEGREIGTEPNIWCVTASIDVVYRRPTPISGPLTVWASIVERSGRRTTVACRLESGDQVCARADLVAARIA